MERQQLWGLVAALACWSVFALVLLSGVSVLIIAGTKRARTALDRWLTPDPAELAQRLARMRGRYPTATAQALVAKIIADQSLKAGLAGALTGLGGLVTLPIAIPVDFVLSARLQAGLIHFIAQTYAPGQSPEALRWQAYAILAGQRLLQQATEASTRIAQAAIAKLITRLLAETVAESLLKVIPLVGALVGFVFNYVATRAAGQMAAKWYEGTLLLSPHALPAAAEHTQEEPGCVRSALFQFDKHRHAML